MTAKLRAFSTTPANNNASPPNGWPEGMLPSDVNNTAREDRARLAEWYADAEWIDLNQGASATGFTGTTVVITGDVTASHLPGRAIRLDGSASKVGIIRSSSFAAGSTTTTLDGYTVIATPTQIELGIISGNAGSFAPFGAVRFQNKSGNYTVVASDNRSAIRYTANATHTLTAAATLGTGFVHHVVADGGTVTFAGTVNGFVNPVMNSGAKATIWTDGSAFYGAFDYSAAAEATIADTATPNFNPEACGSEKILYNGTTTTTAITLANGRVVHVRFGGVRTLTNGASLILPGAANLTAASGDTADFRGEASSVVRCVAYNLALVSPSGLLAAGGNIATPADTTEDTLATVTIPANVVGANGTIRITSSWTVNNNTNVKTARIRFSGGAGTIIGALTLTSLDFGQMFGGIYNKNATNAQHSAIIRFQSDGTVASAGTFNNLAVDTTGATTVVFTGQKATAGDTLTLSHYTVELLPST